MKILFSNPSWWTTDNGVLRHGVRAGSRWPFTHKARYQPDHFEFGQYAVVPFFLIHSAAYTKKLIPEADVIVRDSIARGESYHAYYDYINHSQPDFVVIETATPSLEHDLEVIKHIHSLTSGRTKVIIAGTIDCSHHNDILEKHSNVHAIVQGEYDKQIAAAVHGQRGVFAHNLLTAQELKDSPLPIYDPAADLHYWDGCPRGSKPPQLQLWTSRGCYFRCQFCIWPAVMTGKDDDGKGKRPVRFHTPEYVEAHIKERLSKHNYQQIYIDDDSFNLNDKHVLGICEVMDRIGLPWSAMCRADTSERETWIAMKQSGCFGVKVGFESGNQQVIDSIVNKELDLKEAAENCRWLQSIGINVHGTFTIGLVGETKAQQQETIQFINHLYEIGAISTHQLSATAIIEGTPMARLAKGERLEKYAGAVLDKDFVPVTDGQRGIEEMLR